MRFVTIVTNNDGGSPALIHDSFDAAKAWIRAYLTDPESDPPQDEEERSRMERDLASLTGEYVESVQGSDAWKETIYIALLSEDAPPV